jgi:hypothetical protein
MSELILCKCGGRALLKERYIKGVANRKNWWVICEGCGTRTQDRNRPQKAIDEWNNHTVYPVEVTETYKYTVQITASSIRDAIARAKEYYNCDSAEGVFLADANSRAKTTFKLTEQMEKGGGE